MRIEALVQLVTGDAVRGVVSRRAFWWRYLHVDGTALRKAELIESSGKSAFADGTVLIPRARVLFIQRAPLPAAEE